MSSTTYSIKRTPKFNNGIRKSSRNGIKQKDPATTATYHALSTARLLGRIVKREFAPILAALAVILSTNSALALPKNSTTANGNYVVFNFDKSLGQYDHIGQVQLYQTKTELMVKFTNTRSYADKIEHTLKYKLVRGSLTESDKFMVDHCIESFKRAVQDGTTFYIMVDDASSMSCAVDLN